MGSVQAVGLEPAWRQRLKVAAWWLVPLFCAWVFYVTLSHAAVRKILALDTVENYAFAVFNQLLYNFSQSGHFFQTIHRGYDDSWMWSGHKAALLPVVGWLYGLKPSPVWLAQLAIGAVALGAIPAWLLGEKVAGGKLGAAAGLALYFGYAPIYYMALQDYQDTVLAIPAMLLTIYFSRQQRLLPFLLSALLTCAVREELALMVALVGLGVPGGIKTRLRYLVLGGLVSGAYLSVLYGVFHSDMRFEAPAQTQLKALLSHFPPILPPILYDKAEATRFYLGLLRPVHWLSLASPLTLLPGASGLGIHMLVNPGNGVERVWAPRAHIHHLAPLVPLFIAASLQSLGWIVDWVRRRTPRGPLVASLILGGVILVSALSLPGAVKNLELRPGLSLASRGYPLHPLWTLVRSLPPQAVVATDTYASLTVAARKESYTYDESLEEKLQGVDPLSRLDYLLVNRKDTQWLERAAAWPGAVEAGQTASHVLYRLRAGVTPQGASSGKARP